MNYNILHGYLSKLLNNDMYDIIEDPVPEEVISLKKAESTIRIMIKYCGVYIFKRLKGNRFLKNILKMFILFPSFFFKFGIFSRAKNIECMSHSCLRRRNDTKRTTKTPPII